MEEKINGARHRKLSELLRCLAPPYFIFLYNLGFPL